MSIVNIYLVICLSTVNLCQIKFIKIIQKKVDIIIIILFKQTRSVVQESNIFELIAKR